MADRETFAIQVVGDALGAALGAREDQAAAGFLGEQALEQFLLAIARPLQRPAREHFRKA